MGTILKYMWRFVLVLNGETQFAHMLQLCAIPKTIARPCTWTNWRIGIKLDKGNTPQQSHILHSGNCALSSFIGEYLEAYAYCKLWFVVRKLLPMTGGRNLQATAVSCLY